MVRFLVLPPSFVRIDLNKYCNKCQTLKPIDLFNKNKSKKDGLSTCCKDCNKHYLKNHYLRNKNYYKNKRKEYSNKRLIEFYEFLKTKQCVDCGNKDIRVLEFDHVSDKNFNIAEKINNTPLTTLMNEINKCDIVCANCHRIRTCAQFNYYKNYVYNTDTTLADVVIAGA